MLVLSRRRTEQIRFPQLGITIEVLYIKGSAVRLGIDAPREFHILRGELDTSNGARPDPLTYLANDQPTEQGVHELRYSAELKNRLDAANLAIHLAQNQLRQQLNDRAEEALENALDCLEKLESAIIRDTDVDLHEAVVREPAASYHCQSEPRCSIGDQNESVPFPVVDPLNDSAEKGIALAI